MAAAGAAVITGHTDEEFEAFKAMCTAEDGAYKLKYDKKGTQVWIKPVAGSSVNMLKMRSQMEFSQATMFDVLFDPHYRKQWDSSLISIKSLYQISNTATIDYYAGKSPGPLKNRDAVTVTSWRVGEQETIMMNKSVEVADLPPLKKFIRLKSWITAHYLVPTGANTCTYTWISHTDPRGDIPKFLVNFVATSLVPKTVKTMAKACAGYPAWKQANNPAHKPWANQQTFDIPRYTVGSQADSVQAHAQPGGDDDRCTSPEGEREVLDEEALRLAREEFKSFESSSSLGDYTGPNSPVSSSPPVPDISEGIHNGSAGNAQTKTAPDLNNLGAPRVITTL